MSVVDHVLNALVRYLQKKQKGRKKRQSKRKAASKIRPKKTKKKHRPTTKSRPPKTRPAQKKKATKKQTRRPLVQRRPEKKIPVKPARKIINNLSAGAKSKLPVPKLKKPAVRQLENSKKAAKKTPNQKPEIAIGQITHYFSRIQVVVLKMTRGKLSVGNQIHIKGRSTDFVQNVRSLQIESVDVRSARKGQLVGLQVSKPAKAGDKVCLLKE